MVSFERYACCLVDNVQFPTFYCPEDPQKSVFLKFSKEKNEISPQNSGNGILTSLYLKQGIETIFHLLLPLTRYQRMSGLAPATAGTPGHQSWLSSDKTGPPSAPGADP